jgi:uncharacterized protein (DUF1810 family)
MSDAHDLNRFVEAQGGCYELVLAELRRGKKRGHWMWFIFPQLDGLGRSETARRYALRSLQEAQAYLGHPVLGLRLRECVEALQDLTGVSAAEVLGEVDAVKLRSSLTLFREAGGGALFAAALDRWHGGQSDPATLALLYAGQDNAGAPVPELGGLPA